MSGDFRAVLARVADGARLGEAEAEAAFETLMSGDATPSQAGAFLMALRVRGETIDEITGAARIMREKALRIEAPPDAIDTCGTGGDDKGTLNISTAAALVLMRRSEAERRGLTPLATVAAHTSHSQEPRWFTTAPVGAMRKLFDKTGWDKDEVEFYEINEAFAVVRSALDSWLGRLLLLAWSFSFFFHLCNGIRHLFWDAGLGFDLRVAQASGKAVIAGSIALTIVAWIVAFSI